MVEQRFRNPWDRQPGEPSEAYDRFQIYLALGPERSYSDAVRAYLTPSATRKPRSAEVRRKQVRLQEKFASHPEPDRYVNGFATSWLRLAHRWDWLRRADVYDALQEALAAEKRDLEAQRLAAERQEALARQRKLMEDEAVSLRARRRGLSWRRSCA